jgi:hypothetical protein
MPRGRRGEAQNRAKAYRHDDETRKNIPEGGLVEFAREPKQKKTEYCWDPRELPQLNRAGQFKMSSNIGS